MSHLEYQLTYRRNLPHIQPLNATLFVTFRLAGTLPKSLIARWQEKRRWLLQLAQKNPSYHEQVKTIFDRSGFAKFERILDSVEVGPTWLRDQRVAAIVAESLHYRDGTVYRLGAFSIMPNHVHAVIKPLPIEGNECGYHSLSSTMQSLKGYTAFQCNRALGRTGEFWAHESFDHYIRDTDERQRIVAYVLNNPVKAGYVKRWQDWKWSFCRV